MSDHYDGVSEPLSKAEKKAIQDEANEFVRLTGVVERLRGLLTRIHGIAAEPRPINMAVRLENIAALAEPTKEQS